MNTRPARSVIEQLEEFEEFAGKSIPQALALAKRYGYSIPIFKNICGDLCVLRFQRIQHNDANRGDMKDPFLGMVTP